MTDTMRVAAVQFDMRPVARDVEFFARCAYFVEAAAGYSVDVLLFPELFTLPLLPHAGGLTALAERTPKLLDAFTHLATTHQIDLILGSHLTWHEGRLLNIAHLIRRDGSIARQAKLHITPSERQSW